MTELRAVAAVAAGAALGGVLRLLITQWVLGRFGPGTGHYATLFINVSGSFLIGVVLEVAASRAGIDPVWRLFLATGILGGYTTFSTYSYETLALWGTGQALSVLAYAAGSVVLGIGASAAGITAVRAFVH